AAAAAAAAATAKDDLSLPRWHYEYGSATALFIVPRGGSQKAFLEAIRSSAMPPSVGGPLGKVSKVSNAAGVVENGLRKEEATDLHGKPDNGALAGKTAVEPKSQAGAGTFSEYFPRKRIEGRD
ncbi:unnamed protein product, partial [Choristocarpus tenellus]